MRLMAPSTGKAAGSIIAAIMVLHMAKTATITTQFQWTVIGIISMTTGWSILVVDQTTKAHANTMTEQINRIESKRTLGMRNRLSHLA